jgi:hypothetical protein
MKEEKIGKKEKFDVQDDFHPHQHSVSPSRKPNPAKPCSIDMFESKKNDEKITFHIELPKDIMKKFKELPEEKRKSIMLQTEYFANEYLKNFIKLMKRK